MNQTAAISATPPQVWIGADRLLFCGRLPVLDWHRHSFHCVLLAPTRAFEIEDAAGPRRCRAVLVRGGVRHRLRFDGQPMTTLYIAPHDPHFAGLAGPARAAITPWSPDWTEALSRWEAAADPGPLRRLIQRTWGRADAHLDPRVWRMACGFADGRGLDDGPAALAAAAGLSRSRLAHLVKDHTGSSIGEVQRGYRFVHAARSMVAAASFTRAAHAAGFADSAHFSRAFRAAYGIAPSRIVFTSTHWSISDCL